MLGWLLALVLAGGGADPEMVFLPGAEVETGCSLRGKPPRERLPPPPRTVRVDGFWMDKTEVTVAAYRRCVAAGVCRAPLDRPELSNYHQPDRPEHPVTAVSWQQADAYCRWAGKRLPTQAEWERAVQGPRRTWHRYPWGAEPPGCDRVARVPARPDEPQAHLCIGDARKPRTLPVCSRARGNSREGICDLLGNTSEWVSDWYVPRVHLLPADLTNRNPRGACAGQPTCARSPGHMAKGGYAQFSDVESLDRRFCNTAWETEPSLNGFRCARDAPAP
jgi:formylglycine-generating enzyme